MTAAAPSVTWVAGELIEEGLCSARCLLALGEGPCDCPCEGRWHGVLTGFDAGEGIPPEQRARMRGQARAEARAAAVALRAEAGAGTTAMRREARSASRVAGRRGRAPLPPGERDYPGAPAGDRRAFQRHRGTDGKPYLVAVGRNLGEHAAALVAAALAIVPEGSPVRVVCREANRLKASRSDLDGCRWLSLGTCARLLREQHGAPGGGA